MKHKQKQAQLRKSVQPYAKADVKSSIFQLLNTVVPYIILWYLAYKSLVISYWLTLPLLMIAAGFLIRTFIIFHDCTHGSFFNSSKWNRIVGTFTGVLTHFAFEKWKRNHAIHHATSGNLDKLGTGDVWIMTVDEYVSASIWKRIAYRLYRNPFIMFGLGPLYLYLISNRFNRKGAHRRERFNTYLINLLIVLLYTILIWLIGWQAFLAIQLPIMLMAGSLGIWLFYVQHQFEDSYFATEAQWDFVKAAVDGSSYYKLPKILQWLTGNIGFHHVHHLSPKVPNYYLEDVHETVPPLQKATTITLTSSLQAIRFRLYDEDSRSFITFKDFKAMRKNIPLKSSIQEK